ncbi:hypothetical protein [Ralstonia phage RSP15]|uniref:hypothetical protein n=1 Tax=Ralstonia phage RSP15 TaxID=1785960 RepID=UPI00074D33C0|nr:hypothetical protein BH754_gp047 [Ralstonia phage RSP15]BAU40005.1 hypothetical protein [Ralstonia phage RSP15]
MKSLIFNGGLTIPYFIALFIDDAKKTATLASYDPSGYAPEGKKVTAWKFGGQYVRSPDDKFSMRLVSTRVFDFKNLSSIIAKKEISDMASLYVTMDASGLVYPAYNKMTYSYDSKEDGAEHLQRRQISAVGQIYVPFADSTFDEISFRITVNKDYGFWCNKDMLEIMPAAQSFNDLSAKLFPSIATDVDKVEVGPDEKFRVTFQVTPPRKGVWLYLDSEAGYIAKREVQTDENGYASTNVIALGLEPGDEFDVEAGFKWFSNVNRVNVKVK